MTKWQCQCDDHYHRVSVQQAVTCYVGNTMSLNDDAIAHTVDALVRKGENQRALEIIDIFNDGTYDDLYNMISGELK